MLFAILQKYDFSSKSQLLGFCIIKPLVVCDTAKVRFFKQITTWAIPAIAVMWLFAILQKYDFSSKSQHAFRWLWITPSCLRYCKSTIFQANHNVGMRELNPRAVVCDTAKVRFFKQITTINLKWHWILKLFAILQKYDFSSKSQHEQGNVAPNKVVCDTAKVRFFKQITTINSESDKLITLFAILQKYDFSSKSQLLFVLLLHLTSCLRYCKSTIFQANHNKNLNQDYLIEVVCDTAKVRVFKQSTTTSHYCTSPAGCLRYCITSVHPLT